MESNPDLKKKFVDKIIDKPGDRDPRTRKLKNLTGKRKIGERQSDDSDSGDSDNEKKPLEDEKKKVVKKLVLRKKGQPYDYLAESDLKVDKGKRNNASFDRIHWLMKPTMSI